MLQPPAEETAPAFDLVVATIAQSAGIWIPALIVSGFCLAVFFYLLPLLRTSLALKAAKARIESGADEADVFSRRPKYLHNLWKEYTRRRKNATLRAEPLSQSQQTDQSEPGWVTTVSPEEVFSEQAVLDGYNRNVAVTLAGVFTGLGILGTFIGLVNGLSTIQGTAEPDQVQESVLGLLSGMHTAFYTSIYGISFSLFWLFLDRSLGNYVQKRASHFFQSVRLRYPVASAEWFLHRLFEVEKGESEAIQQSNRILLEAKSELAEQKYILQDLGSNMAIAFQDALNSSITEQLSPAFAKVVESIETLSTQLGDRQVQAMDRMVESFQDQLSEKLHGQFENLASALKDAAEWQNQVHSDLEGLLTQVKTSTEAQDRVVERSIAACDMYGQTIDRLADGHSKLNDSADALQSAVSEVSADLKATLEATGSVAEEVAASADRIGSLAGELDSRIELLRSESEVYRDANTDIREFLARKVDELDRQMSELTGFWNEYRNDLSSIGDGLKDSVAEFSVFTADKLKEIFNRFDSEMATVVEHLGGTLSEIRESTEEIPRNIELLRTTLDEGIEPLSDAAASVSKFDVTASRLSESVNALQSLAQVLARLEPLGAHLDKASSGVVGADQSIGRLNEQLKETDDKLGLVIRMINDRGEFALPSTTSKSENVS